MVLGEALMVGVGELLRDRRKSLGYTQEQLEELSGVPQNTISKIELSMSIQPRWETLEKLGRVLDLTMDDWRRSMGWVIDELPAESDDPLIAFVLMVQDVWSPAEKVRAVEMLRKLMLDGHVREVKAR